MLLRTFKRPIALLLIILQVYWIAGCSYYSLARQTPGTLKISSKKVVYIHGKSNVLVLDSLTFEPSALRGRIIDLKGDYKITLRELKGTEPEVNEIHIIADSLALPLALNPGTTHYAVPFSAMSKVYQYDLETGKTVLVNLALIAGATAVTFATIVLVILLTKSSCPFIYSFDGTEYHFEGEIYSGAIHPPLERDDYLALSKLSPVNNSCSLKMTNEVHEIQHTNSVTLIQVDHNPHARVMADRTGLLHAVAAPVAPLYARAPGGNDVSAIIKARDSVSYLSDVMTRNQVMDSLILGFKVPSGAAGGKVILHMRNSFWLDYTYGCFLDLFGDKIGYWNTMMDKGNGKKMNDWKRDQGFPLTVSIKNSAAWKMVDYCDEAGPMGFRDYVIPVSRSSGTLDTVQVKLQFGSLFWEIDYAGMDFSPDTGFVAKTIPCNSAVDKTGVEVTSLLAQNDSAYYHQPEVGDAALLSFTTDDPVPGKNRSYILHSKGYYTILRQPAGAPKISYLKSFKRKGRFVDFSNEHFRELVRMVEQSSVAPAASKSN